MMRVGDRKQGINKRWPYTEALEVICIRFNFFSKLLASYKWTLQLDFSTFFTFSPIVHMHTKVNLPNLIVS